MNTTRMMLAKLSSKLLVGTEWRYAWQEVDVDPVTGVATPVAGGRSGTTADNYAVSAVGGDVTVPSTDVYQVQQRGYVRNVMTWWLFATPPGDIPALQSELQEEFALVTSIPPFTVPMFPTLSNPLVKLQLEEDSTYLVFGQLSIRASANTVGPFLTGKMYLKAGGLTVPETVAFCAAFAHRAAGIVPDHITSAFIAIVNTPAVGVFDWQLMMVIDGSPELFTECVVTAEPATHISAVKLTNVAGGVGPMGPQGPPGPAGPTGDFDGGYW